MNYCRVSWRKPSTVLAEILLEILAYNIDRLRRATRGASNLACECFAVDEPGYQLMVPASF